MIPSPPYNALFAILARSGAKLFLGALLPAVVAGCLVLITAAVGPRTATAANPSTSDTAIEYYHPGFDHYFLTASPTEIAALNSGQFSGWIRTGFSFPVFPPEATQAGTTPICRFYGNPALGLDSHFYSSSESECDEVLQRFPDAWLLESRNVFRAYSADAATGTCPAGTHPVHRLFNQRADANHRYTNDDAVAAEMELKGFAREGYGSGGMLTAFCVPAVDTSVACTVTPSSATPVVGGTITLTASCTGDPTSFQWIGCSGAGQSCEATSATAGARAYVLYPSAGAKGAATPVVTSVVWQATDGATPSAGAPQCSIVASMANAAVNTDVRLTASCRDTPTRYNWSACTTLTDTCVVRSSVAGAMTYSLSASDSSGTSSPSALVIVNWFSVSAAIVCSIATSHAQNTVNLPVTITARCTGDPTSYTWSGCTSTGTSCTVTSPVPGNRVYTIVARKGTEASEAASVLVNWLAPPAVPKPTCTISASNSSPTVNTNVTLTASCSANSTSYSWSGCSSNASTCTTTSSSAGSKTYTVAATNAAGTGLPASLTVAWKDTTQPPAPPGTSIVACTLAASSTTPVVGSQIALGATCTGGPTSYTWTGCNSTTSSCTATTAATGSVVYAVTARNATSASSAASVTVVWQPLPPVGVGMPTSADFLPRARDPRGIDAGFNTFKRLPNGHGLPFGGNSHSRGGNNSVVTYDPVADRWTVRQSHQRWTDVPVPPATVGPPWEARGLTFLGNSDNGAALVVDNEYWHFLGERGQNVTGNYRGILDTTTWRWTFVDDTNRDWPRVELANAPTLQNFLNSAYGHIPALDMWYMFGGDRGGNPTDALYRIERNPGGQRPFKATYYGDAWGNQAFAGSERLRYISNQHFARGTKVFVYGGLHESRSGGARTSSKTLWEIDLVAPSMRTFAVNTLPDGQRVEGSKLLAYHDASKDIAVITNGSLVNVYDFARGSWNYVPVNTPPDSDRLSPSQDGAGRAAFYSPEVGQLIILGGHSKVYGLRLNYGTAPPPPTTPPPPTPPPPTPPPPPLPPPSAGAVKVSAVTVPYPPGFTALGSSKHLTFSHMPDGRWYSFNGDHARIDMGAGVPSGQSGRQEGKSLHVASNNWRMDQPYFIPDPAQVQPGQPDDSFQIVRGAEIWLFTSARAGTITQKPGYAVQLVDRTAKWSFANKRWSDVGPTPPQIAGDRAWGGGHDSVTDRFLIPSSGSLLVMAPDATYASRTWSSLGVPGTVSFWVAGIAIDEAKRTGYVYDHVKRELWSVDLASYAVRKVATFTDALVMPSIGGGVRMLWHPVLRAVIVGAKERYHVYEVDSGKVTTLARPDGWFNAAGTYVHPSISFFDPETGDVVSIGGIDFENGTYRSPHYWRLKFTR